MSVTNTYPSISIIIPAHNEAGNISRLLDSISKQTIPANNIQTIIVSNCSTDNTVALAKKFEVEVMEVNDAKSPYIARNKALAIAKGDVIVFTDGDCIAKPQWLEEGVRIMEEKNVDLVGGKITYPIHAKSSLQEICYAINDVNHENTIRYSKVAFMGNLFVRKNVFDTIKIPQMNVSGGDTYFTFIATSAGYKIAYAKNAVVEHPAHNLRILCKKAFRIGKGKGRARNNNTAAIQNQNKGSVLNFFKRPQFAHLLPWNIQKTLRRDFDLPVNMPYLIILSFFTFITVSSGGIGFFYGIFQRKKG